MWSVYLAYWDVVFVCVENVCEDGVCSMYVFGPCVDCCDYGKVI